MTVHRIQVAAAIVGITGVLLMYHVPVISGDLEPVLQRCCQSGEAWARNHTTCTGPPGEPGAVPAQDRLTCLTSLYICCIRSHRKTRCERGKEAATEGRQCGALDDSFRDCCDGCSLGIQAAISRMPCSFARFSFGAPWDEAYIDCCEKFSAPQGISQQTRKVTCEPNYPCSQVCDVVDNQIKCSCYPGFTLAQDQATCQDVDECQLNVHTCNPANEFCSNLVGGFKCMPKDPAESEVCRPGLIMNQQTQTCEDFDECTMQPCARNQVCVNTYGSFTCEYKGGSNDPPALVSLCSAGFAYNENNGLCIDVDECAEGTHTCNRTSEICQNSHGGFQCLSKPTRSRDCPAGFKWNENSGSCEDFDECREELHGCDVDKSCRNTVGGYECEPKCFLLMKFDPVQNKCVESNACVDGLHDCKPDEACIATMDAGLGYVCIPKTDDIPCPPGFKPSGPNNEICDDINECEEFPDICDEREMCINGIGSYDCVAKSDPTKSQPQQVQTCPLGMQFDEQRRKCVDIDECLQNIDRCNRTTQDCVNYNGTYECVDKATNVNRCPPGYQSDSRTGRCEDIDECTGGRHKCLPDKEECVNVPGAYRCQQKTASKPCPPGHRFNTSSNTCRDVDECSEGAHTCSPSTQNCVNAVGSYRCVTKASCPHGYKWSGNKCEDVNECAEFDHDCDTRTHYCVNTPGSYQCQTKNARAINCGSGFVFDTSRNTCTDINECESVQPCSEDQVCENTIGSYVCNCPPGFILDVVTRLCKDLNECQLGMHVCADSQRCDNTVGSYTCVRMTSCGTGYTLNAATSHCEDDDECALNTHNCGPGFSCRNIQGSFRCDRVKCPPGQKLLSDGSCKVVVCGRGMEPDDAGNCIDINECALDNTCRTNQRCINTVGSYRCQNLLNCSPGYELNEFGNQCIDVDECARRIYECGPLQTCRNRPGGYVCECPRGYALNLQRECEDVDECTRFRGQVCSRMSECVNTQGSYVCNCKEGFRKADDDKNCVDIDECAESPNICQQVCNNVWGSYQCSCQAGFTLGPDNRSCQDIDECKTYEGHGDLCIGYCVNEPGSFSCSCPPGYRLSSDKRTCQDIDECQEQNVCSGDKQVCLNTRGGYKCNRIVCPPNYVRDKDHRNRCKKAVQDCPFNDLECLNEPKSFSYNYITFVSNIRIPYSGQLDLFTMRGPRTTITTVEFSLQFKEARAPPGIAPASRDYFHLRRTAYNEAMVSLIKSIEGPQEIELDLVLKMFHNGKFAGNAVAKIFIFVSEHKF